MNTSYRCDDILTAVWWTHRHPSIESLKSHFVKYQQYKHIQFIQSAGIHLTYIEIQSSQHTKQSFKKHYEKVWMQLKNQCIHLNKHLRYETHSDMSSSVIKPSSFRYCMSPQTTQRQQNSLAMSFTVVTSRNTPYQMYCSQCACK